MILFACFKTKHQILIRSLREIIILPWILEFLGIEFLSKFLPYPLVIMDCPWWNSIDSFEDRFFIDSGSCLLQCLANITMLDECLERMDIVL